MHISGHVSAYALRLKYKRVQCKCPEIDDGKYMCPYFHELKPIFCALYYYNLDSKIDRSW